MKTVFKPSLVITSSRRPSRLTNALMKQLSVIFDSPLIRRGKSSLDEIFLIARDRNINGIMVIYSQKGNPSVVDFYYNIEGYYLLFGRLFLLGLYINRNYKGVFDCIEISREGESKGTRNLYQFLLDYFNRISQPCKKSIFNKVKIVVDDLINVDAKKFAKLSKSKNFNPAILVFQDSNRGELILKLKVHHVWRSEQH